MRNFAAMLLIALFIAGGATIHATSDRLPARVASHFDLAGHANGYRPRDDYLILMLLLTFGVPLLVVALNIVLPRVAPGLLRIPARDYWLAPDRRNETCESIATSGFVIACAVTVFMIALHLLVVEANSRTPPRVDNAMLWTLVCVLIVGGAAWQLFRWRRFQRPQ